MIRRLTDIEAAGLRKIEQWETRYIPAIGFTLGPVDRFNFQEVTYYGEPIESQAEWIYVLANKIFPGILKIGYTRKTVAQRVAEINSATGVLHPYVPVFAYKCKNGELLEKEIHANLQSMGKRISSNREGFEIDIDSAIDLIKKIGEKYAQS